MHTFTQMAITTTDDHKENGNMVVFLHLSILVAFLLNPPGIQPLCFAL